MTSTQSSNIARERGIGGYSMKRLGKIFELYFSKFYISGIDRLHINTMNIFI